MAKRIKTIYSNSVQYNFSFSYDKNGNWTSIKQNRNYYHPLTGFLNDDAEVYQQVYEYNNIKCKIYKNSEINIPRLLVYDSNNTIKHIFLLCENLKDNLFNFQDEIEILSYDENKNISSVKFYDIIKTFKFENNLLKKCIIKFNNNHECSICYEYNKYGLLSIICGDTKVERIYDNNGKLIQDKIIRDDLNINCDYKYKNDEYYPTGAVIHADKIFSYNIKYEYIDIPGAKEEPLKYLNPETLYWELQTELIY